MGACLSLSGRRGNKHNRKLLEVRDYRLPDAGVGGGATKAGGGILSGMEFAATGDHLTGSCGGSARNCFPAGITPIESPHLGTGLADSTFEGNRRRTADIRLPVTQ